MALVAVPANHANIANGYHVGRMARPGFSQRRKDAKGVWRASGDLTEAQRHGDEGSKNRKTIGLNQIDYNCSKKVFRSINRSRFIDGLSRVINDADHVSDLHSAFFNFH
jgi:hypothetical protein